MRIPRLALVGLLTLVWACSHPADDPAAAAPDVWAVGPDPLLSIGEVDGDPRYLFSRIAAIRVLPDRRVVVADAGSAALRVFRPDGGFEREIGRRGEGPGEFLTLRSLQTRGADTLVTYDMRNLRLSRFLASGELLGSTTLRTERGVPETYMGRLSDGTLVLTWLRFRGVLGPTPVPDSVYVGRFDGDSLQSLVSITAGMWRVGGSGNPGYSGPPPLSPHHLGALVGDTLFRSDGMGGRVEAVTPDGEVVRSFTVAIEPWDLQEAAARLQPRIDSGLAECCPRLADVSGAEEIPTLSEMLADPESLLWVKAYDPATDSHAIGRPRTGGEWWVLETDGTVSARVTMPDGFRPMEIRRNLVAGIARDGLDVERVVVYPLTRG